jgi:hypothetical protein
MVPRSSGDKRRAITDERELHSGVFKLAETMNADMIDFRRHSGRNSQFASSGVDCFGRAALSCRIIEGVGRPIRSWTWKSSGTTFA